MGSTCIGMAVQAMNHTAYAQGVRQAAFNIPAGALAGALAAFGRQSGMQVTYVPAIASGKQSPGVSGTVPLNEALARILQGTGLNYTFTNANTVAIGTGSTAGEAPPPADGSLMLGTIEVSGGGGSPSEAPFATPAPVAHISQESIERFRGMSPADIFRGTPGVMSADSRNGGGAIDMNIRGMQGFGRVATTIDGAENGVTVYQGYQGLSNRTYIDPDLLADIDITKGSDVASRGIAGTVAMRTLDAADIVKPGENWAVRVKGGLGTNTAKPTPGAVAGYNWPSLPGPSAAAVPSLEGMDRPGFLDPTNGYGSFVAAVKEENYDLFAGYAYRNQGNYFAGNNGPSANPVNVGPQTICNSNNYCQFWPQYIENTGLTNYRAGEEVLNTALQTESWIAKGTLRFENGQSLQVGYTGYRGEAGDILASGLTGERSQPYQREQTTGTKLDTGTMRYRWNPDDSDLIDLKANLWVTRMEMRNPRRGSPIPSPESIGLPNDYRVGSDSLMWGGDVTNRSVLNTDYGTFDLTYGLSYLDEDTKPSGYTDFLEGWLNLRNADRQEAAAFTKVAYKPVDWLTLNAGLRYSHFWSQDRNPEAGNANQENTEPDRNEGGFSPSAGVTLEPVKGLQFFVNYSDALRFPSMFESVSAFTIIPNPNLRPERSSNWEIGANYIKDNLFAEGDRGMIKANYFNWDVSNYIARAYRAFTSDTGSTWYGMQVYNIDRAKFSGLELATRYEWRGFTADIAANYYLNVAYCSTADSCDSKTLYGDYATNYVPPEYSLNLTLSQKLFNDAMTIGGRISYNGPRAIEHGQVTAQGLGQFIAPINWKPYTLIDVFMDYKINDNVTANFRIENLTDQYYVDPLGLVNQPAPGRTFFAGLTGTFGGATPAFSARLPRGTGDWTGFYAGAHTGAVLAHLSGTTTALDGTPGGIPATESANFDLTNNMLFGAQAGFNYQFDNRIVLGLEADFSKTYLSGSQKAYATEGSLAGTGALQAEIHSDVSWVSSVRARLGYAFDNGLLLYGTGGLALAHENEWRDQYRADSASESNPYGTDTSLFFVDKVSSTRTGFTIGGGGEYALNDRWSIKAEYSYSHFGNKSFKFNNGRAGVGRDYTSRQQVGTEWIDLSKDPNMTWICAIIPEVCIPYEQPVYETVVHPGSSGTVNGRDASNALATHALKLGLNYRF